MTDTTPTTQRVAQQRHARYLRALTERLYDLPELRDDDTPDHLRNNPTWVDVIGRR